MILPLVLLLVAVVSPCVALVPKQPKQVTRGEVVERLANAPVHAARPRRSNVPCPTLPTGTAPFSSTPDSGYYYWLYYSGSGFTVDPNNPGNDFPNYQPRTADIGFLDIPDAVEACTQLARYDGDVYQSFDLHFLTSTCTWICVQYYDDNSDIDGQSYWDQANPDVAIAYGYSG